MKLTVRLLTIAIALMLTLTFAACASKESMDVMAGPDKTDKNDFYNDTVGGGTNEGGNNSKPVVDDGLFSDDEMVGDVVAGDSELEEDNEIPDEGIQLPVFTENPFVNTADNDTSTFSADVDTASYAYFRKLVNRGYRLDNLKFSGTSFRTEEFINYFKYDVNAPDEGELFGVATEIVPCPWNAESMLLRVSLQAEQAQMASGNNLVFLIDVSGSMQSADKLPLLKKSFAYLVENLGENDRVSIVTYSGKEALVLDGCNGMLSDEIMTAINSLNASGSTNGEAGLTMAYQVAEKHMVEGGNNRIIMATDGDLNVGISSAEELKSFIEEKRDQGVYLSILGFGTGNYRDSQMETLADNGNGVYYYIDGESEAEKVFGTDLLGTLYTVAEDVKLQITFNSEKIESYRLIGYENRVMSNEDFNDDTKDAGEVGAAHQVTVCYELKMSANELAVDPLITLKFAYKNPGEPISIYDEYKLGEEIVKYETSEDMKFIGAVIEACMLLHNSEYAGELTINTVLNKLDSLDLSDYPDRAEFRELVRMLAEK